ncbi:uncharacterized protein LOC131849131 [Achroia grisella]|uniref:uncharacterized protein LOC131849131 n=1 Tax=Achroia grisella TaxID=688607 RepID=UPI0027D27BFE|nr:uncharacterized protein LOC131849131 [Achroia grisella]
MGETVRPVSPDDDSRHSNTYSSLQSSVQYDSDLSPIVSPCCIDIIWTYLLGRKSSGDTSSEVSEIDNNIDQGPQTMPMTNSTVTSDDIRPSDTTQTPTVENRRHYENIDFDKISLAPIQTPPIPSTSRRRGLLSSLCCFSSSTQSNESAIEMTSRRGSRSHVCPCKCKCKCNASSLDNCLESKFADSVKQLSQRHWCKLTDLKIPFPVIYSISKNLLAPLSSAKICVRLSDFPVFRQPYVTQAFLLQYVTRFPGFLSLHPSVDIGNVVYVEYRSDEQVRNAVFGLNDLPVTDDHVFKASYISIDRTVEALI